MKCIFIYNPNSGKRKVKKKIEYIYDTLCQKYEAVDIYETKSQQDLIDTAAKSCDEYDAIIFSGGDGAFNNLLQGIMKKEKRPVLGYIPAGTVCDVGRNIGSSKKIKKALKVILDGYTIDYDCGYANGKYFTYTASTGTFVSMSFMTSSKQKKYLGVVAYYINAIKEFFNPTIRTVEFVKNNKIVRINSPLLLILNSRSVGGFPINRRVKMNSGKFDIYVLKFSKNKISGAFNVISFYIRGFLGLKLTPISYHLREKAFTVKGSNDLIWTLDGEEGPVGQIDVEYIDNAFKLMVNKKVAKRFKKNL